MTELLMLEINEKEGTVKTHSVGHLFTERNPAGGYQDDPNEFKDSVRSQTKLKLNRRIREELAEHLKMKMEEWFAIGKGQYARGEYRNALKCHSEALEYGIQLGDQNEMARCHIEMGLCCYRLSILDQALYHSHKAIKLIQEKSKLPDEIYGQACYIEILCYHQSKDFSRLKDALNRFKALENLPKNHVQRVRLIEIELLLSTGEAEAQVLLKSIEELKKDMVLKADIINHLLIASKLYQRLDQTEHSIALLKEAETMAASQGIIGELIEIYSMLGELLLGNGEVEAGKSYFNKIRKVVV